MRDVKLDIIIPVYNEGKKILKLLKLLKKDIKYKFRVFICYDKDSDNTIKYINKTKNKKKYLSCKKSY